MTTFDESLRRSSVATEFATALGFAVYSFASLEWHAACCANRLREGFAAEVSNPNTRTAARNIADVLIAEVSQLPPSDDKDTLLDAAREFLDIVRQDRNYMYHAIPITHEEVTALSKGEKIYNLDEVRNLAVRCFDCSIVMNRALHGFLPR